MIRKYPHICIFITLLSAVLLSACDYGRMWETPAVRPHEEPMPVAPEETVPFSGGEMTYRSSSIYALHSPIAKGDEEAVALGENVYFTYCAQCHGKFHDGYGTVGQSFHPLPTDLKDARIQRMADAILFKRISYGVPGGKQPPLATTVSVLDRWRVIAYIKSLRAKN